MTTTIAGLPDHNRVADPLWQQLFHAYRHVITPLRHNGWITDIELCGGEYHVRADLTDGTELIIASDQTLPSDPAAVNGWHVLRQDVKDPSRHTVLYDSTPNGAQSHHRNSLPPMFARIDELPVPKQTAKLSTRTVYSARYGMEHHQGGGIETPGLAVARFYEWSHHMEAVQGYRRVWEQPWQEGYPLAVFENRGRVILVRVTPATAEPPLPSEEVDR